MAQIITIIGIRWGPSALLDGLIREDFTEKVKSKAELRQCALNRTPESFPGRGLCITTMVTLNEGTVQ